MYQPSTSRGSCSIAIDPAVILYLTRSQLPQYHHCHRPLAQTHPSFFLRGWANGGWGWCLSLQDPVYRTENGLSCSCSLHGSTLTIDDRQSVFIPTTDAFPKSATLNANARANLHLMKAIRFRTNRVYPQLGEHRQLYPPVSPNHKGLVVLIRR